MAEAIPRWIMNEGAAADDNDKFWSTAVFPHPGDKFAMPAAGGDLVGE